MNTQGISWKATGAIASLVLVGAACGESEATTASTEAGGATAPAETEPVAKPAEAVEAEPEVVEAEPEMATTDDEITDDADEVVAAESSSCSAPDAAGPALDIGVVAQFDLASGRNAEGIAFDSAGNSYVSFAQSGEIVRLGAEEADTEVIGEIPGWDDPFPGLGDIAFDEAGNLYAAVSGGAFSGVWVFECAQGEPTRIDGTDSIGLPNALVFDERGNLFVTDSNSGTGADEAPLGAVWQISPDGDVELWAEDVVLGGTGAIGIGPIGANGVAINDEQLYVAVTEKASLVEIPILDDGSAGAVSVFATNDALLMYVEGVAVTPSGTVFAAEAFTNTVVAVGPDGSITPVAAGVDGYVDQPANIAVGIGPGAESVLYLTNNARFSNVDGGIGSSLVVISTESN